jgi:hypothetical protein
VIDRDIRPPGDSLRRWEDRAACEPQIAFPPRHHPKRKQPTTSPPTEKHQVVPLRANSSVGKDTHAASTGNIKGLSTALNQDMKAQSIAVCRLKVCGDTGLRSSFWLEEWVNANLGSEESRDPFRQGPPT